MVGFDNLLTNENMCEKLRTALTLGICILAFQLNFHHNDPFEGFATVFDNISDVNKEDRLAIHVKHTTNQLRC